MPADWPLTGRTTELRHLLDVVTGREPSGVVLAGAAGVGKTHLARECLRLVAQRGKPTAAVTATRSASGLPFGALAALLPAVHHGEAGTVDDRADLLRRSAAALVDAAGGERLVLLVDDAHLLDDASATLVHQLAATGAACVLVTLRSGEPAPDPITALWKDGLAERLEILGLNAGAVAELMAAVLGGRVDPLDAAHLAIRCEGNALFLRELVLGALRDGTLVDEGGIWRLVGSLSPSERLVELVEGRLAGLTLAERELLELVSLGEPVGPAELGEQDGVVLAETLERKGLLRSGADGRRLEIRLAHPMYGDVLRMTLPALRGRGLARSLAETVEGAGARRREDILRIATWRLDSGGASPDLMLAAATQARWRYDFPLAERLARAAVEAGAGFDAGVLAAQLAGLQGRGVEAEEQFAVLTGQAPDDTRRGVVTLARLDNLAFYLGRIEAALQLVGKAEKTLAGSDVAAELASRRLALTLAVEGPAAAAAAAEPILAGSTGRPLAWSALVASQAFGRRGCFAAAAAARDRGHAAHLTLTRPMEWHVWLHDWMYAQALAHSGQLLEAEALARQHYEEGLAERSPEAQAFFAWLIARTVGERGDVERAVRHGREAVVLFRQLGRPHFADEAAVSLGLALAIGGRGDEAAVALPPAVPSGPRQMFTASVDLLVARAFAAAAAGQPDAARDRLDDGVALARRLGDRVGESTALHTRVRIGLIDEETVAALAQVAEGMEGELGAARAEHARTLAAADSDGLMGVSAMFEHMGAMLLAAEAAVDAAVAARQGGNPAASATAASRAAALAGSCVGAATPGLRRLDSAVVLTPAERRVAVLAARNVPNKEIAAQLFLSVRTVDTHLQRIYAKLGIPGRAHLAEVLGEDPAQ